jgi:hypothetical protein
MILNIKSKVVRYKDIMTWNGHDVPEREIFSRAILAHGLNLRYNYQIFIFFFNKNNNIIESPVKLD